VALAVVRSDSDVVAQAISSLVSCLWPFQEKGVGHAPARAEVRVKLVINVVARRYSLQVGPWRPVAHPSPASARSPPYDSGLVADEPPTAGRQDRRAPDPACPVLHPAVRREPLDRDFVQADRGAHRGAGVSPDLIERSAPGGRSQAARAGVSLRWPVNGGEPAERANWCRSPTTTASTGAGISRAVTACTSKWRSSRRAT